VALGDDDTAEELVSYLDRAGMARIHHQDPSTIDRMMDRKVPALVVVHPLASGRTSTFCREKVEEYPDTTVVVVHSEPVSDAMVGSLYRSGAAAVFHWPHDRKAVVRTLFRVHDHDESAACKRALDLVIEETVNNVLRLHRKELGRLDCSVFDGVALLRGQVDALWKVREAEDIVSELDGVEDVIGRSIQVTGGHVDDRTILRSLEEVTRASAEIDPSTLAFRVDDGHVTIAGTVNDRSELRKLLKVVQYVRGTRSIKNLVVVSSRAKRRDRALARSLRRALGIRFPKHRIKVGVFGGMVMLAGEGGSASRRRDIVELALSQDGVIRVVDRMGP
jgi:osmotically-inducible protein OsmY